MAEYAKLVVAVDSTQVKTAERDLQSLGVQSRQVESAVVGLAAKAAAAFGGIKLGGLIKDVTMANSRFEQLGLVMGVVGRNAGMSAGQVSQYAKEVEGMGISMAESRQTVIRMAQAQMDLSKASDLARLAQDAAVIANTNSSEALGRLIYGLQSGQVEILRNMGLNVNFAGSYTRLAAEMGVTADQLSEVDKVQARTNAVMEAGVQIAGAYEVSMENAAKQVGSTTRYLQDMGVMWGSVFSKAGHDAIFGYSDMLKSLHERTKELRDDGTLDRLADAIATISRGVVTGAKVLGAYAVAVYAIPAAKAAAIVATTAYQAVLATFSAQVAMTTTQLLSMRTALNVLAAGFAGWQIGTYLRNEFEIVEKAGIALMGGMHSIAIQIGGFFDRLGVSMKFALTNPLDSFRNEMADLLQWLTGLHQGALRLFGLEGLADSLSGSIEGIRTKTGEEHRALLEQMKADTQREADAVSDIYADMFADVGKNASVASDKVGDLNDELKGTGSSSNVSGIKKVDDALKRLLDRLDPATASWEKYNNELEELRKHLKGDELARAVGRLTAEFTGGDASGPADAIKAYREELDRLEDKINPAGRAAREFREEQALLRAEIERSGDPTGKWTRLLEENERQMRENTRVTNQWTEWTESALERVDSAFADAWRNIGDGFSSFRDNLVNAFKQMLAELAHMAITRPIIMQIGAAMGIGGGTQGQNGIWGMLGGGGEQGGGLMGGLNTLRTGYNVVTGGLTSSIAGGVGAVGGFTGSSALSGFATGMRGASLAPGLAGPTTAGATGAVGAGSAFASAIPYVGMAMMGVNLVNSLRDDFSLKGLARGLGVSQVLGSFGVSLFGSGERFKRTVGSATGSYSAGQYTSGGLADGWYAGSKTFGDDFNSSLDALNQQFSGLLGGLFDAFDIDSSISTETRTRLRRTSGKLVGAFTAELDGQILEFSRQYGKDGKIEEAMEQFADDILGEYLAESIVNSALPEYLRDQFRGLTEADQVAETLAGVIARFDGVNSALGLVGITLLETTDAGLRAADAIAAMGGGIEAFNASVGVYYDQFYSAAEKQAHVIEAVTAAFEAADITLADSRESYRAMVEDIDVTTEAGQQMFAAMMGLAGQAAQYYSIVEQQAAQQLAQMQAAQQQSVAMLGANLDASFGALQRSIAAQQKRVQDAHAARIGSLNDMAATASSSISALTSISKSLDAAVKRLRGTSDDATRSLRAQAVMTLNSALVSARSGQSLAGFDGLQDALDVASQMDTALYSSLVDFEREQGRTANLIAELEKTNGKQLSAEERLLQLVRDQISAAERQFESEMEGLDMQLAYAQSQVDALNGIDNSVMSVASAVSAMDASVVAALKGLSLGSAQANTPLPGSAQANTPLPGSSQANTPANNPSIVDMVYQTVLGREADASGRQYWSEQLQSGSLGYDRFAETLARAALQNPVEPQNSKSSSLKYLQGLGVPGFASGGVFGGGLRIVGEQGPELEVTGPSRIYSAGQTAAMLSGGNADTVAELRQLRTEIHNDLRAIAKHTQQTARRVEYLERWDFDGLPEERAAV